MAIRDAEAYLQQIHTLADVDEDPGFVAVARAQWFCVNCSKWQLASLCVCLNSDTDPDEPDMDQLSCLYCHAVELCTGSGDKPPKPKITKFEPTPVSLKSVVNHEALEKFMKTVPKAASNPERSR